MMTGWEADAAGAPLTTAAVPIFQLLPWQQD